MTSKLLNCNTSSLLCGFRNILDLNKNSLITNCTSLLKPSILFTPSVRTNYTFNLNNKLVRYRRATRPKKTNDHSLMLNYEQTQFAEKIGVTKSWNSWNTCKFN